MPGRRHCTKCGCWRPCFDFSPRANHTALRSVCKACERTRARVKFGYRKRGKGDHLEVCRQGLHPMVGDNLAWRGTGGARQRYCKPCSQEYSRIWGDNQRRREGRPIMPKRSSAYRRSAQQKHRELLMLDAEPFARWLEENLPEGSPGWLLQRRIDNSQVRRLITRQQRTVHIDTVDHVLTHDDMTSLRDLYPGLYEEAELVVA